ncbi:Uncharacterized protein TCM_034052 isoform 1 [Theobroma cacao]|uniref:Uncharacterized protein isoform 1 n=1 Tax=Theobroma cacao TaxID=3641 RepID=A0A061FJW6_THECC|nr:Uncharacterized protein TCM_034052 isoform 1 [Theobroma cacao]EOY14780.1 Uncharacterized protein TCM_034052 isoform 1 [Theobroma cacao]
MIGIGNRTCGICHNPSVNLKGRHFIGKCSCDIIVQKGISIIGRKSQVYQLWSGKSTLRSNKHSANFFGLSKRTSFLVVNCLI